MTINRVPKINSKSYKEYEKEFFHIVVNLGEQYFNSDFMSNFTYTSNQLSTIDNSIRSQSDVNEHNRINSFFEYLKNLNTEYSKEYEIIKNLSGQLIIDNYKRNPTFGHIRRTTTGYYIERCCYIQGKHTCYWRNVINMNTNEVTLSCNKDCTHTDLKKKKSLKFIYI